jgi:very-short-patch-repair endonuclease
VGTGSSAHREREAADVCETADSILTYAQLRASGLSRTQLQQQLDAGYLRRVRRGIYARIGSCDDAVTAAEHGGSLACVSAARHAGIWVLDELTETVHVWLHGDGHRRHPSCDDGCGCMAHWDAGPAADVFGRPSVPRILRQILACRGVEEFFVAVESARRQGLLNQRGMIWLRAHTNAAGREAIAFSRSDADSGLESLLRWRLRRYGLRVRTQAVIPSVGRIDLLIGARLLIETDGKANHDGALLRHKDLVRDANAAAWGYVTLRFDYALVVHDWDLVERAILGQVAAGHHLVPAPRP